jgi:hypothetical protein
MAAQSDDAAPDQARDGLRGNTERYEALPAADRRRSGPPWDA